MFHNQQRTTHIVPVKLWMLLPHLPAVKIKILLSLCGPDAENGMTIWEISMATGLAESSIVPLLSELESDGIVVVDSFPGISGWYVAQIRL